MRGNRFGLPSRPHRQRSVIEVQTAMVERNLGFQAASRIECGDLRVLRQFTRPPV
jgi:hypothetical protein